MGDLLSIGILQSVLWFGYGARFFSLAKIFLKMKYYAPNYAQQ